MTEEPRPDIQQIITDVLHDPQVEDSDRQVVKTLRRKSTADTLVIVGSGVNVIVVLDAIQAFTNGRVLQGIALTGFSAITESAAIVNKIMQGKKSGQAIVNFTRDVADVFNRRLHPEENDQQIPPTLN